MDADENTCPACGNPLTRYGCKDVEQVGSFCRGPTPPRPGHERTTSSDEPVPKRWSLVFHSKPEDSSPEQLAVAMALVVRMGEMFEKMGVDPTTVSLSLTSDASPSRPVVMRLSEP